MIISAPMALYMIGTVIGLWGFSLVWRGVMGDWSTRRRLCPSCGIEVATGRMTCECGFEGEQDRDFRGRARSWRMGAAGAACVAAAPFIFLVGSTVEASLLNGTPIADRLSAWYGASMGMVVFGLVVLLLGWRGDRPRGRRRCPMCWYDMSKATALSCTECGHEVRAVKGLYRPRRSRGMVVAGAAVMLLGVLPLGISRYQQGGTGALAPTTVMVLVPGWFPDGMLIENGGPNDEWTLEGRLDSERVWGWQRRLLTARTRAGIMRSDSLLDAFGLYRLYAKMLAAEIEFDALSTHLLTLTLTDLTSGDAAREALAASVASRHFYWTDLGEFKGEIEPFGDALERTAKDTASDVTQVWTVHFATALDDDWVIDRLFELSTSGRRVIQRYSRTMIVRAMEDDEALCERIRAMAAGEGISRPLATELLAYDRSPASMRLLLELLHDADDAIAVQAAWALMRRPADTVDFEQAVRAIEVQAASDRASRVGFLEALESLHSRLSADDVVRLLPLLEDEDGGVASAAINVVGAICMHERVDASSFAADVVEAADRPDVIIDDDTFDWISTLRLQSGDR